jgi:dynein heavy chain
VIKINSNEPFKKDAASIMPSYLEMGYLSGHALLMLEQVLSEIYLPLLTNLDLSTTVLGDASSKEKSREQDKKGEDGVSLEKGESLKADLVVSVQKFANQVSHFSQQVSGGSRLKIPEELQSLKNVDVEETAKNVGMMRKLETLAEEWIEAVSSCLTKESKKVPVGNVSYLKRDEFHRSETNANLQIGSFG